RGRTVSRDCSCQCLPAALLLVTSNLCRRLRTHAAAITLVENCGNAACRHQEGAQPDPEHEGVEVDAYHPGTLATRITERGEQVAKETHANVRLGLDIATRQVAALFRMQGQIFVAIPEHTDSAVVGHVIGAGAFFHALEHELVATDRQAV